MGSAGAPFLSPFPGFCAFSAATMNSYVSCFPRMNLGRSKTAAADFTSNLTYLDQFRAACPMGDGWWHTIHQTQTLYQRASRDGIQFHGMTRENYEGLHSSMHDASGVSPVPNSRAETSTPGESTTCNSGPPKQRGGVHHMQGEPAVAAAISLRDLSHSQPQATWGIASPTYRGMSEWNDSWPMWAQQAVNTYGFDGVHFEGNSDVINLS